MKNYFKGKQNVHVHTHTYSAVLVYALDRY